jgi:hypothetical protein
MGAPADTVDGVGRAGREPSPGAQPHAVIQPVAPATAPDSVTHAGHPQPVAIPGVVQAQPVALCVVAGAGLEPAGLLFTACDVWPGRIAVESPA